MGDEHGEELREGDGGTLHALEDRFETFAPAGNFQ